MKTSELSTQEKINILHSWVDKSCINCADFHDEKGSPYYISMSATCQSEEVVRVFGKYQDAIFSARSTPFTGCRFFREKKPISEIVKIAFGSTV